MRTAALLVAALAALALSGCLRDREDMAGMEAGAAPTTEPSPPDWLVSADTARGHVPGSAAYAMTSDELAALDEQIITSADTQVYGGLYSAVKEFPGQIRGAECSGETCRYGTSGESDLEGHFFDLEYQPVMEHKGIRLGQAFYKSASDPDNPADITGYGAWMHYNTFVLQTNFYPDKGDPDAVLLAPYSIGQASGTNPVSGTATWNGVAIGMDLNQLYPDPDVLQGDAGIVYDFGDASVDVTLDNFVNLRTGAAAGHKMEWADVAVKDGAFSDGTHWDGKHIAGAFYGAYHEEVGGAYKSGSIAGSFGASRSDRQ